MSTALGVLELTLTLALASTALVLPFGVGAGYLVARLRDPWKSLAETCFALPLFVPPTAVGLVLLLVCGPRGLLGGVLPFDVVFTPKAVVLAGAVMAFPLLMRAARSAFEAVDPQLIGMARSLGASPLLAWRRVTLPLASRGLVAGALLAFTRALGEFGATIIIAGNIPGVTQTLPLAIFQRIQLGEDGAALGLAALTAVLAFAAVLTAEWLTRRV